MKGKRILVAALLAAPHGLAATAETTDDAETEPPVTTERVSVTASRIGVVDQRIVALEESAIRAAATHHGTDLLREMPGLAVSPSGGRGSLTQVRLRGAEANHLLVTVDGFPVNDPGIGSAFDFGTLDLAGVSRVELVSGPQSTVWGSDATAGVLNLDTLPSRSGRRVSLGYGGAATLDADIDLAHVGERVRARLAAGHVQSDGDNVSRLGDETDGFRNDTIHAVATAVAGRWHHKALARHTSADVQFDPAPFPDYVPVDGDRETSTSAVLVGWETHWQGKGRISPSLSVFHSESDVDHAADGAFTNATQGARQGAVLSSVLGLAPGQRASAALEVERERFRQTGEASAFGDPNQGRTFTAWSVAGEYQADLGAGAITASARHDSNGEFEDATTLRVGATTPAFGGRLFANVAEGIKNPTFIERFGYFPGTFIGNPNLTPERSTALEMGMEYRWGALRVNALAFHAVLEDEIDGFAFVPDVGGFTARNVDGESRRTGAEWTAYAEFGAMRLRGNVAWVDATEEGEREVRRPRLLASVALDARLGRGLTSHFSVLHNGAQLDRDFSTWPATTVRLGSFRLVRASLAWAVTPRWTTRLTVDNLFDADYTTVYGYGSPGRTALLRVEFSG
ncbi:MAG: TonB-dependent receptor [Gammaproteobacteria bacterium]|nr:TonB-dependent receptor [Gammaproteobacteria bacterium]